MPEISIPNDLAERLRDRIQYTEFEDIDEYAAFVLSEVVTRIERDTEGASNETAPRDEVEDRLQSLGYLEE